MPEHVTSTAERVLELQGLASGYGGAPVLRGVSLGLGRGEILALLGKNGMGKSTLVKTVLGFIKASAGSVRCVGRDTTGAAPNVLARAGVSYAPQEKAIFQDLSIADNLRLAVPSDRAFTALLPWVTAHFPLFGDRLGQKAGTLSGGEQKMLLLSRALMVRPRLVIADEISEGLQPTVAARIGAILRHESETHGTSVLLVEQNIGFALATARRWTVLNRGEIDDEGDVGEGAAARIFAHLSM